MQYRKDKYGNDLSVLGFGCMRFTTKLGKIDFQKAEREIMTAYKGGVNYFDTAYIYPGSEALIGEIFEKNGIRKSINIATKLPHYLIKSRAGAQKLFEEELRRLRTDYVDYYLMHMLTDIDAWARMKDLGVLDWLEEMKKCGKIRQLGFSYHGNTEMFIRLVDAYDWDFCMIQYNYMDEHTQAGKRGLQYAQQKGLPVMIMEPLRGGKLASRLPEEAKRIFAGYKTQYTPAQWAFRWLYNQPEVTTVLSGMNSVEMVQDNLHTADTAKIGELGEAEAAMLQQVSDAINAKMKVGCTGCGYCVPCPKGVDIPGTFAAYNRLHSEGWFAGTKEYLMCTTFRKTPTAASNCIGCGKCEQHCPQGIPIREKLAEAQKALERTPYKVARKLAKWFVRF